MSQIALFVFHGYLADVYFLYIYLEVGKYAR